MAAPIKPVLSQAFGRESYGFALTVTTNAPTVAQLNAASGINMSCYVFGDQEGATADTEKVTLPRLLCETQQYQANGATTWTFADVVAAYDPQAAAGSTGKKVWETLLEGTTGWLWRRQGILSTVDVAPGQIIDLFPVSFGPRLPGRTSADANGVFQSTHPVAITGSPIFGVAIAS